ncbi:hypothetical protein Q4498_13830 [Neptunomonas phycophila]|uniref:hypothetical protein n=2 Tax=Bacteria TaxID=2 RepID=UPI0026E272D2|nr:hypothetical protein [Neptunomonas phycophila]MDO6469189.1 hypothetical protein [Neptunomonas phycophila]
MSAQSSAQQVVLVGPNGQAEAVSLEKLDTYASLLEAKSDAFSNISKAGDVLSDMYDKTEAALASTYDNASQVVSEGYTSAADWAGNTSDAAKQWGQDTYEVVEQWGVETADATRTKVIQLSEDAQLKWDAFKKEAEIAKEQAAAKAEELATKTGEYIEEKQQQYYELTGDKGIDFGSASTASPNDPETGEPNCECQSVEPCCVFAGVIKDADRDQKAGLRKIEWPLCPGQPSNLLMLVKDVKGLHLGADIEISAEGKNNTNCPKKYEWHPSILEKSDFGDVNLVEKKSERTVYFDKPDAALLVTSSLFPAEVLGCFIVLKKVIDYVHGDHLKNAYTYNVVQCAQDETMGKELKVVPLPYLKIAGNLTVAISMAVTTQGFTISPMNEWFSGSLEAQYGDVVFSSKVTKKARGRDNETNLPFPLYVVEKIKQIFEFLSSKTGVRGETLTKIKQAGADIAEGTGVTVTPTLQFTAEGVETKKVSGSPNVKLDLAALKVSLGGEIKGQIDILEIAITLLSGGAARVLQKAKEKAESVGDKLNSSYGDETKKFNSELVAMLDFGGSLNFITDYGSAGEVELQWDGNKVFKSSSYEKETKQEIKFSASAKITFVVQAEVVILEAEAGINGVLNTAWNIQYKQKKENGELVEYKRYFFEGLKLKGGIYYGVTLTTDDKHSEADLEFKKTKRESSQTLVEKEYDLLEPTVKEVTDDIPMWIKTS